MFDMMFFARLKGCKRREQAFSLVEVVLALGLCVFAVISLVALLPVSLNTARDSVEITRRAKATQQVVAELTQSQFANVMNLSSNEWYFDYEGSPTPSARDPATHFTIRAQIVDAALPQGNSSNRTTNLLRVKLTTSTPREKPMPGSTTATIPNMGY